MNIKTAKERANNKHTSGGNCFIVFATLITRLAREVTRGRRLYREIPLSYTHNCEICTGDFFWLGNSFIHSVVCQVNMFIRSHVDQRTRSFRGSRALP